MPKKVSNKEAFDKFLIISNLYNIDIFRRYQTVLSYMVDWMSFNESEVVLDYKRVEVLLFEALISKVTLNKYLREMVKIGLLRRVFKSDSYVIHPYYAFKGKRYLIQKVMADNNFLNMTSVESEYKKLMNSYDESRLLHKAKKANKKRNAKLVKIK